MGKNRDRANALIDAFEKELSSIASEGGRDVLIGKKFRAEF